MVHDLHRDDALARVLVIHDQLGALRQLARRLAAVAHVVTTTSLARAASLIATHGLEVVVAPATIASELRARHPELGIVDAEAVTDASGSLVIALALERQALRHQVTRLAAELEAAHHALDGEGLHALVNESLEMRTVIDRARHAARGDAAVLVTGEPGTGKRALARAIHRDSERRQCRIVRVGCAAIDEWRFDPDDIVVRARGGTVLLDEVGRMPTSAQSKLARAMRTRPDVRMIATTSTDLRASGALIEELLALVDVLPIAIPPLRDRRSDILPLADRFVCRHRRGDQAHELTSAAREALVEHDWPGNAAELEAAIRHSLATSSGPYLVVPRFAPRGQKGARAVTAIRRVGASAGRPANR